MKKILGFLFFCFYSIGIIAAPIDHVVVFGDSLSDNGNLYQYTKILPKSPPYFLGRFSNGPTWAEHVGKHFYNKYYIDYKIYAVGGATAILHKPTKDFIAPMLLDLEIDQYLADTALKNKSKTLAAIWIGSNDYLFDMKADPETLTTQVVDKISASIQTLIKHDVHQFLLINLPDLGRIPFAEEQNAAPRFHLLAQLHNQKLDAALNALKKTYPDVKFSFMNIYDVFTDVMNHPEKYNALYHVNITDTTTACWAGAFTEPSLLKSNFDADADTRVLESIFTPSIAEAYAVGKAYEMGNLPCGNAEQHIFWDHMHPTETVHQVLGEMIVSILETGETQKRF